MAQRISRKQLKHDEFVDAATDFGQWLEENWATVLKWAAGVLVLVLIVVGWFALGRHNRAKAQEILGQGLRAYEQAEAAGFAQPALLETALQSFDEASEQAGGGAVGDVARFYRGASLYRLGRLEQSAESLEQVATLTAAGPTLTVTAQAMLAQVHVAAGRTDDAVALLEGMLDEESPALPADQILLMLGNIHDEAGRSDRAREAWQRIVDEFPQGTFAAEARRLLSS